MLTKCFAVDCHSDRTAACGVSNVLTLQGPSPSQPPIQKVSLLVEISNFLPTDKAAVPAQGIGWLEDSTQTFPAFPDILNISDRCRQISGSLGWLFGVANKSLLGMPACPHWNVWG